jgi:hypothetical protein
MAVPTSSYLLAPRPARVALLTSLPALALKWPVAKQLLLLVQARLQRVLCLLLVVPAIRSLVAL